MKLQLLQNKLPKLPKLLKSPIHSNYMLGKIINFKLPKSYLSYLNRKNNFQVGLVSIGKIRVSSQPQMNKGFGKIGKIFYIFLTLQILFSCQNSTDLETNETVEKEKLSKSQSKILAPSLSIDDGTGILNPVTPITIVKSKKAYIRYNIQDDEFSINSGPWYQNPYATHDCDQDFICAINYSPCNPVFHSGTVKFLSVQPVSVPTGVNLTYSIGSTPDVINFSNPNCTYFNYTDIMHFNVTYQPW